ncbi:Gfo/Idh/MocA family protein [Enterococcus xiangfangensis]|uniref:Gfo/Idh/MocA family oxidoreductase n=1 Tax=Enterococcus xiangfangensis TaxID=1296537 RepID=A0ABU3F8Y3_9ENTE|nr:Gfo/Idh/MocA family oxidoreductase [Enterococcus xiangfangensis]MBM7711157.1 putative dehydrogenase [Enterococcus xiangfangensis]MDT2759136.1 Gfo/Idh/MocA family oxidoreductase [Enterococcus xiangfangensis]
MKVGILGIAHMHAESYVYELQSANIEITGVYDHHLNNAEKFCRERNLTTYPTVEEVLSTDCDTVLVCSENVFHKELTLSACEAGKHIIVEKPMALSMTDAAEMIEAAKINQVKLMVAHPVRFSQPVQDLKKIMLEEDYGPVLAINASNHGKNPGGWFIDPLLSGGGALIDHTVHISDLVNYLFQLTPEKISAFIGKSETNLPVEDIGLVNIQFKEKTIMSLDTSWNRPTSYPIWGDAILEVVFEKGYVIVDGFGRKMQIYSDDQQKRKDFYFEENMDHLMFKAFIEAIENDLPAPVSGEDGLYTVLITQAAFESAKKKQAIDV